MFIKKVKIRNFKSIYGEYEIDFTNLTGLIKLSGPIGAGKTTIGDAILWGLLGNIKGHNNPNLVAWNTKDMEVDIDMISNNKNISIKRHCVLPLEVTIDGKPLVASNKKGTQLILETEYYDITKLAIERMCIISFNQFKSLANMTPADTKQFLDEIFGFKTFTEYNNKVVDERKNEYNNRDKLETLLEEVKSQIIHFNELKQSKHEELSKSINIDDENSKITDFQSKCTTITNDVNSRKEEKQTKVADLNKQILEYNNEISKINLKINEYTLLGKQEKEKYNLIKSGICPTCGHIIEQEEIDKHKDKMYEYANNIKTLNTQISDINSKINELYSEINIIESDFNTFRSTKLLEYNELITQINEIKINIEKYNNSISVINENYDQMISESEEKLKNIESDLNTSYKEIAEWDDMNELFSKTLRYKMLTSIIPQINSSIGYFINKFEQPYYVQFDEQFNCNIYTDNVDKKISYNDLSTGQKKTLDIAIILGILQNIISSINFNILFLDELFSNMDANTRNILLSVLDECNEKNRTIFIINHAEMADDLFKHKIRVSLQNTKIFDKKMNPIFVKASKYDKLF